MAGIRRVFLGWEKPLLHCALEQLRLDTQLGESGKDAQVAADRAFWDLSRWTLVLPVARAAKRLEPLLGEMASAAGVELKPPRIITVGSLPERLYRPTRTLAGEMQQTLAWTRVLLAADDADLAPLMPVAPPRDPVAPWLEMAGTLRRLCEDLAADAITPSDVIAAVETDGERERWARIAQFHKQYLLQLEEANLADPHQQRAQAIAEGRCQAKGPVVLIGCVDLGTSTCRILEAVAGQVSLYVGAPESHGDLFDLCGRVSPGRWNDFHVELEDEHLISAGDANGQASAAAALLQEWSSKTKPAPELPTDAKLPGPKFTVGISDDSFGPLVETDLMLCGYRTHRIGGTTITRTATGRMMQRVSEFLQTRSWNAFAALIRHADVLRKFAGQAGSMKVLNQLDSLRNDHFPVYLNDPLPEAARKDGKYAELDDVVQAVLIWLKPLGRGQSPLGLWCEKLVELIESFYEQKIEDEFTASEDLVVAETLSLLRRLAELPASLDLEVTAHAAIDMVLQRLADPRSLLPPGPHDVEIAGWLELPLDDAPRMVVVGLNQPFVPQAVTSDTFLPGSLRARLRVADNERRFARDLYILQMIYSTRAQRALVVGRFGPDGSPTPPSRLLAACPSAVTLRRVRRLLEQPPAEPKPKTSWDRDAEKTNLPLPNASQAEIPTSISVTAFRAYLECPFRFYLRHVLHLRPLDDAAPELAANQFGDLVHAAVERFGDCNDKDLTDPKHIQESLTEHLHAYAGEVYGAATTAAVRLQITQAERRLRVFAEKQAERMAAGWRIDKAEAAVRESDGAVIECAAGRRLKLKGRIDRIDYHPGQERWAILDYKTHGHEPLKKHYDKKNGVWLDLQLPLYLLMLKALDIDAEYDKVDVGYFNIPDDPAKCNVHLLELTSDFRSSAFDEAKRVAASILDGDFRPQLDSTMVMFDDYSMIMQTGIAENLLMGISGEAEGDY